MMKLFIFSVLKYRHFQNRNDCLQKLTNKKCIFLFRAPNTFSPPPPPLRNLRNLRKLFLYFCIFILIYLIYNEIEQKYINNEQYPKSVIKFHSF